MVSASRIDGSRPSGKSTSTTGDFGIDSWVASPHPFLPMITLLLLLDEPTNHLDIDSMLWLEGFLLNYPGTVFFVTHDRMFMTRLATRIIELDRGKIFSWSCDYKTFLERKQAALDIEEARWDHFDKKLAEEEIWIRKGVKPGAAVTKAGLRRWRV